VDKERMMHADIKIKGVMVSYGMEVYGKKYMERKDQRCMHT
jgi:hypothetical protein